MGRFSQPPGVFGSASLGQLPVAAGEVVPEFSFKPGVLALGTIGLSTNFALGSLVGGATFTDTRSTTGTFQDWEYPTSPPRTALVNEARFQGLRRIANLFAAPTSTLGTQSVTVPAGQFQCSFTGTGTITFTGAFSGSLVGQGANTRVAFNSAFTCTSGSLTCTVSGSVTLAMLENVTSQSNQNPSNYKDAAVSYGAGVNGVDYTEKYQNGNTVTANVVTSGTGAAITGGALLIEPNASTNYFQNSDVPATHTTSGNLPLGTYTLWMDGSGSVAVAGATATITGAGVASSGVNVTFVVTVTGTVLFTVVGSPTRAQAESFAARSSYIATTTAPVVRGADAVTCPNQFGTGAAGSAAMSFTPLSAAASLQRYLSNLSGGGLLPLYNATTTGLQLFDGTERDFLTAVTYALGTPTKIASAWSGVICNGAKDGVLGTQRTYASQVPNALTQLLADVGGGAPGPNALVFNVTFNTVTPSNVASATV